MSFQAYLDNIHAKTGIRFGPCLKENWCKYSKAFSPIDTFCQYLKIVCTALAKFYLPGEYEPYTVIYKIPRDTNSIISLATASFD